MRKVGFNERVAVYRDLRRLGAWSVVPAARLHSQSPKAQKAQDEKNSKDLQDTIRTHDVYDQVPLHTNKR